MLILPESAHLHDLRTNRSCPAEIVRLTKDLAKQIDNQWWQIGGSRTQRSREGDHSWRWPDILGVSRMDAWSECLGVVTPDGVVQGAINYHLNGKSLLEPDLGAIFVHHIATAPRNRPWLVESPQFGGVGAALLAVAVRHGYALGLGGRTVVPSLPTEHTRHFYEKCGFRPIAEDEDGIIDYELAPEVAEEWLREKGYL
jgi:hypothetical protein